MDGSMPERPLRSSLPKGQEEVVGSEALYLVVGRERKRVDDLHEDGRARLCANLFQGNKHNYENFGQIIEENVLLLINSDVPFFDITVIIPLIIIFKAYSHALIAQSRITHTSRRTRRIGAQFDLFQQQLLHM
jgi:hypothetical protein